jgi:quercetin dioxygenase-like cupin family protein
MKWVVLLASAAFAALLPLAAHAAEPTVIASPAAVKWHPAAAASGLPKGAEAAVLLGDPKEPGPFVLRVEFPSGAKVMPHTHNADHYITVISGVAHVGFGDKFDPQNAIVVQAGGFIHIPAGVPHYVWFTTATVLQDNDIGPFKIDYVNTAKVGP